MKLIRLSGIIFPKILLVGMIAWLWSANVSAYDFSVTCYGDGGKCAMNGGFTLSKISNEHDNVKIPLTVYGTKGPTSLMLMLASCTSDTSCTLVNTTPVYQRTYAKLASAAYPTYGDVIKVFLSGNIINGTFAANSNADRGDYWNRSNLCLSISFTEGQKWFIWGINYGYPVNQVMCSVPVNRVAPDTCSVSTPSIDVAFGQIERSTIGTSAPAKNAITKNVSLSCTGTSTHNFSLKLNMTPASWSNSQIATSNGALGVSISKDGTLLSNGTAFDMSVLGSGTAALSFSLLKNPTVASSDIATGDFTASATLIVTEQ